MMMRLLFKAYKGRKLLYRKICRTHGSLKITLDEALANLYLKQVITGDALLAFCNDRLEIEKLIGKITINS